MSTVRRRLSWQRVEVADSVVETSSARSLTLDVHGWNGHRAGQHVDIRLTADDGYQATRSFSISSGPTEPPQITVQRVDDGEVSPYLVDIVEHGDSFEARGPIGGYFVWEPSDPAPLLVAGGSGIAPLRSIWRAAGEGVSMTILYSAQSADRIIFGDELASSPTLNTTINLTRESAPGYGTGRLDETTIRAVLGGQMPPLAYVCGPTEFVEAVADHLLAIGLDSKTIRTERFG